MPKNKVSEWSSSPGNNTDVGGINIAEGCAPSNINNAIREVMAQIKDMQSGTDGDNFSVGGNLVVAGNVTVTGNISGTYTGTVATATNALSLGGNLANTYAPLASPIFTGNPTAPTPVTSDDSTSIATTAYVTAKISAVSSGVVTISGGTTGLTPATATAGAVTLGGTLNVANGGTGSATASGARTNLGATTIGSNIFTLTNPSAVTFPRFNADNTVSALSAADFRTAIGATSGTGTVTSITAGSYLTSSTAPNPITTTGTLSVNASSTNVANSVVARDASGNFTASTITANLNGNASTATSATTATTASSATSATTATNIAGGGAGQVPYNTGTGATAFLAAGTSGQILRSNGTAAPSWLSQSSIAAGSATNIAGGGAGQLPYNTGSGATSFVSAGSAGQVLVSNGTSAPTFGSALNLATEKTASGIAVEFTGIPSWVNNITVMFNAISLNTNTTGVTKIPLVQLGTGSTTYTTSGYKTAVNIFSATPDGNYSVTSGIPLWNGGTTLSSTEALTGQIILTRLSGNTWVFSGQFLQDGVRNGYLCGSVSLGAAVSAVRFYVDGTIQYDAGTINIMYG